MEVRKEEMGNATMKVKERKLSKEKKKQKKERR